MVPHICEIMRIPKEPPTTLGAKRKRGGTRGRSKSRTMDEDALKVLYNPEEGWDDDTEQQCIVYDYPDKEEVKRREWSSFLRAILLPAGISLTILCFCRHCIHSENGKP